MWDWVRETRKYQFLMKPKRKKVKTKEAKIDKIVGLCVRVTSTSTNQPPTRYVAAYNSISNFVRSKLMARRYQTTQVYDGQLLLLQCCCCRRVGCRHFGRCSLFHVEIQRKTDLLIQSNPSATVSLLLPLLSPPLYTPFGIHLCCSTRALLSHRQI